MAAGVANEADERRKFRVPVHLCLKFYSYVQAGLCEIKPHLKFALFLLLYEIGFRSGSTNKLTQPTIYGEVFDNLMGAHSFYGSCPVALLTDYENWIVCVLDAPVIFVSHTQLSCLELLSRRLAPSPHRSYREGSQAFS